MGSSDDWSASDSVSAYLVFFSALLAVVLVLSKYLHESPVLSSILPEAGLILLVGMFAGFVVDFFFEDQIQNAAGDDADDDSVAQKMLSFSPEIFFLALLPPIIFNSGYHLRRELFLRHITPTILFACVGTVISAVSIAFLLKIVTNFGLAGGFQPTLTELLTFGALISATDPVSTLAVFQAKRVDPQLFMLVFGESVLNDAVGLVLFKAFGKFVSKDIQAGQVAAEMGKFFLDFTVDAICSPVLGLVCGCGAALVFKHVDLRKNRLLELSLYVLIMYVPFLLAQLIGLSGIVTILFTGMAARAYVVPNLSTATATNADLIFRLAAHLAESSIFLELGLCVFGLAGSLNILFILWALLACLIARALNIYPIAFLFNKRNREPLEECEHEQDHSRRSPLRKNETHIEMSEVLANADYQASADDQHGMIEIESQATDMSKNTVVTLTPQVRKDLKIHGNTTHMLWFSGLRGAVAYACVRSFPDTFGHQKEFVITTMVIVLVTVFVLGGTTEMVLNHLEIEVNVDEDGYMEDWHRQRSSHSLVLKFEAFLHKHAVRPNARVTANDKLTLDDDALQSDYQQHVEVTEFEHIDAVVDMGYRERESLFDYGAKCE